MKNQGVYNLGVAVGIFWAVNTYRYDTTIYLLSCVIVFAIVGAFTVNLRILFIQGLYFFLSLHYAYVCVCFAFCFSFFCTLLFLLKNIAILRIVFFLNKKIKGIPAIIALPLVIVAWNEYTNP